MLDISVTVINGFAVVGLKGALVGGSGSDHLTEVIDWLCEAHERRIALHTAGVSSVDTDGLVALIGCYASVSSQGGDLVIKMPSATLLQALRRTGLDAILSIVESRTPDPNSAPNQA